MFECVNVSKVLMCDFHYDYIKNKNGSNSILLFSDTDSLMYEIKTKIFMKILVRIKKCLILVIFQLSQNIIINRTN